MSSGWERVSQKLGCVQPLAAERAQACVKQQYCTHRRSRGPRNDSCHTVEVLDRGGEKEPRKEYRWRKGGTEEHRAERGDLTNSSELFTGCR